MNNEMDDYSYPGIRNGFGLEPTEFNFIRNGTSYLRPMSSMSPTIVVSKVTFTLTAECNENNYL